MGGCEFGAEPSPAAAGVQAWVDKAQLPLAIASLLITKAPLAWASIGAELIDFDNFCATNPDPPEPFTIEDFVDQSAYGSLPAAPPFPRLILKASQWMRYQAFLTSCQCKLPPPTPGANCAPIPATVNIGGLGSIAGPYPVTISSDVMASIVTHPNGDWTWFRHGAATTDGGASSGNNLDVQIQLSTGAWVTVDDLETLNALGTFCNSRDFQASVPRFNANTAVRLVNNAGGTHTITNWSFCFCSPTSSPEPLPPEPSFPALPDAPPVVCDTNDLCLMVNELSKRLGNLAVQLSDIQAALTGHDVLTVLSETTIAAEGELTLVLGTRAVSVELTALGPDAYTSALGRPRGLMRVGSVRWGDGIGYSPRRFIDGDRFDDTRPAGATSLSWQLLPGTQGRLKFLG